MKNLFKKIVVKLLTLEARLLLKRTKPTIIAITGSVGKTSVKDAIYQAIKDKVRARKSEKSYNSEIGVPLSVLGLPNAWSNPFYWLKNILDGLFLALFPGKYPEVLVLEMGVDRPGDMKRLAEWIKPDIVVLTRLPDVPVHVEYFSSPEAVISEKLNLVDALKSNGVFVYNHDDEKVLEVAGAVRQQSIGYSRYSASHFQAKSDDVIYESKVPVGMDLNISHIDETVEFILNGAIGVQHAYNFAAAAAVANLFDISLDDCSKSLMSYVPPPGRMRLIPGIKNTTIIDDTYNSSPVAAERALSTLFEIKAKRKIAVLGDMLELGQYSVLAHEKVGEQAAEGVDLLVTVGVRARGIAEGALDAGLSEKRIMQFDDAISAGRELQNLIQDGDVVLIKGSQGVRCEKIVEEIMANPNDASKLLVRQSTVWREKA